MEWKAFDPANRTTYPPVGKEVELEFMGMTGIRASLEERESEDRWEVPGTDLTFRVTGKIEGSNVPEDVCPRGTLNPGNVRAWRPLQDT